MAPRDFFVRLGMVYKCTEFHCCRTIGRAGLVFLNSVGGAMPRPFMKILTCVELAMLNKYMEFGEAQTRRSG